MTYQAKDTIYRALRTAVQAFIGVFLSLTVSPIVAPDSIPPQDVLKRAALSGAWAAAVALTSYIQNWLEVNTRFPAVGRDSPPAQNPIGPPAGIP